MLTVFQLRSIHPGTVREDKAALLCASRRQTFPQPTLGEDLGLPRQTFPQPTLGEDLGLPYIFSYD
ncbi:hypothetical protein J6590_069185 [Homalodisca vitripennis]|nr:hypothetical protein J6590_069185 [Homalodisca vitripennis]